MISAFSSCDASPHRVIMVMLTGMTESYDYQQNSFEGARVLITTGNYRGSEAVCLGRIAENSWAISPDGTNEIINLKFERDFSLLIDLSSDPAKN